MSTPFDSIESATAAMRNGSPVIVVDTDPNRACGALVLAAQHVTADLLRFFLREGRGYLSIPIDQSICLKFGLRPLEGTRPDGTTYTMSYNLVDRGSMGTTGQSTHDRALAIRAIVDPNTSPSQLRTPGFIHPVLTTREGVLDHATFPAAATDLCRLAELEPAAVTIHILGDDGELARLEALFDLAANRELKIVSLQRLVAYRSAHQQVMS
jgi:3,4-dihydroxy-2-butanone 4-phosphate synthase